jgi:DNA-binding transcriptional LysR family regulator
MAVPAEHPLAERNSAPLAALANETLLMVPREMAPHVYDAVIAIYQRAGFTPKFRHYAPSVPGLISMVNVGMGIALVPYSMEQWQPPGVRYVRIEGDGPRSRLGLVWRRDNMPATVRNFIDVARRVVEEHTGPGPELPEN